MATKDIMKKIQSKWLEDKVEEVTELIVEIPMTLKIGRKKHSMSINHFLTSHHTTQYKIKCEIYALLKEQLLPIQLRTPINVEYIMIPCDKRRRDSMNFHSTASKCCIDALTHFQTIPDDSDDYIKTQTILPSVYDKEQGGILRIKFSTITNNI